MVDVIKKEKMDRMVRKISFLINELTELKGDLATHDRTRGLPEKLQGRVLKVYKLSRVWIYPDMV